VAGYWESVGEDVKFEQNDGVSAGLGGAADGRDVEADGVQ
jgi:hypothetical protein